MDKFAQAALNEYNSEQCRIRPGDINGNSFWNVNASQFLFVPSFEFPLLPAVKTYEFIATDCTGATHTFSADCPTAPLTPIWKDLPTGMVELKVEGIHSINGKRYISGVRTFYKAPPFPGRTALPPRARSYKESALKAFEYTFNSPVSQYWLQHGKPDPTYYHNVYPSKMISSLAKAMIAYAELNPQLAEQTLKLATNAADYLISITYSGDTGVSGLPPTYSFQGLIKEIVDATAPAADKRQNSIMLIYPAQVGSMYLLLEQATGDTKYFDAAQNIADYYKNNVQPNGSWPLMVSARTNQAETQNDCCDFGILTFLNEFYKRTQQSCWHTLEKNYFEYLFKTRYQTFNWEGQFEDSYIGRRFTNPTHFVAGDYIDYILNHPTAKAHTTDDIKELMRFIEDQFVVWGDFAPWSDHYHPEKDHWFSPAAMEQYHWYVPIDSSTATVLTDFLNLYKLTKDELFLEKACALGDSITRRQHADSGVFPTHWMWKDCTENLRNFWFNCHIHTSFVMMELAKAVGEI